MTDKTILVIGTYDTKDAELGFLADVIRGQGGRVLSMDVSVLGEPSMPCDLSKHDVAQEGGSSIEAAIASGDENTAMQIMAHGASLLVARLFAEGRFDGMVVLGGTMGTDLALDVCLALPLGVPKYIVSTVSFSPLIPPERIAADAQMILWAGGLYGLNSVCKASLSQAAGAVLGAARAVQKPDPDKPLIGMMSLGTSALKYVIPLKPALEARGYEVAVFHATGMGGRAFESLAAQGAFACVFDFCTQELGNHIHGSNISAGADRLTGAGLRGTPQIVAPGCYDLVDIVGWQPIPGKWADHPSHAHNRLLTSIVLNAQERRQVARAHAEQLARATAPTAMILPRQGLGEWDREGADLHDQAGLDAFLAELTHALPPNVKAHPIDAHINDAAFADTALAIFDKWRAEGLVP
ncbi:Tm-1-like ATP-binding domain-containing protein [Rhodobacteraceae bacterium N5(2021)]|uniref:Tm-1-like ATP-binding domain-containing protein n=1 Tax=Gymnodinialimonas phycosphaerae TaxID=2841589 RepID=A0A975YE68_9RHOB|nr:Tm-1-like ATP-binding domain-containing protein [Gymnodinialimonas phycosphaerae]MBY4893303.1 Tm-1-like ATP-binding domain-containing protein [Gymnodinialimonas phycosphaerae]